MDPTLNALPCGYLSFSDEGKILSVNETLADWLGASRDQLVGAQVESILTVGAKIFFQTHLFPLLKMAGKAEEIYLPLKSASGAEREALVNGVRRVRDGAPIIEWIVVQMTRRGLYEDELLRAKKSLEEANAELDALKDNLELQVNERTLELRKALADLESFSYAVAHDLRAPLRAIVSTSEILREEASEKLSEDHKALLSRQSFNTGKLADLIDDLLKFARLGRNKLDRQHVNVSELTESIVHMLSPPETLAIVIEPDLWAHCDLTYVSIALQNLLENAIKYSHGKGEIRVGSRTTQNGEAFFVSDEGIGFDMSYASKIFLPFERLHRDTDFAGSGLGLATAKRMVELHGGVVWAESELDKGSTFLFTLSE